MELPKTVEELSRIVRKNYDLGLEHGREFAKEEALKDELKVLRDQFAMAAMQGLLAKGFKYDGKCLSITAYQYADAMLAERAKRG